MSLLDAMARAMEAGDVGAVAALTQSLATASTDGAQLSPADRAALLVECADWLADNEDVAAIDAYDRAIDALKAVQASPVQRAQVIDQLAAMHERQGAWAEAATVWQRAVDLSRECGDDAGLAMRLERMRAALVHLGKTEAAKAIDAELATRQAKQMRDFTHIRESPAARDFRYSTTATFPWSSTRRPVPDAGTAERPSAAVLEDLPDADTYNKVLVHFATHRAKADLSSPYTAFGSEPDTTMVHGYALVSLPVDRAQGQIPRQGWLASKLFDADPAKHATIRTVEVVGETLFFSELKGWIGKSERQEALVFVHGYRNTFADALFRCAQLAVDLDVRGAAVLYSWPSKGTLLGYKADDAQSRQPQYHDEFRAFLLKVARETGAARIHLVGHSMGCQFLLSALDAVQKAAAPKVERLVDELIFASPDVDIREFDYVIRRVAPLASRVTVYASQADVPLTISGLLTDRNRAGVDATGLAGVDRVQAIDTSAAPEDFMAHSAFATRALDDVQAVVWLSLDPSKRRRLKRKQARAGGVYWEYDPATDLSAFRRALDWARRIGIEKAWQTVVAWLEAERPRRPRDDKFPEYEQTKRELDVLRVN